MASDFDGILDPDPSERPDLYPRFLKKNQLTWSSTTIVVDMLLIGRLPGAMKLLGEGGTLYALNEASD